MAKLIGVKNDLEKKYKKHRNRSRLWGILCGAAFVIWVLNIMVFHSFDARFIFPCFISFGLFGILAVSEANKGSKLRAGLEGEKQSASILQQLPDTYTILQNVVIQHATEGIAELDQLILGENGIFIVETKNYNGTLTGSFRDRELTKTKITGAGNIYTESCKNPVRQIKRQIHILKQYLKENGVYQHITGIVYFSNPSLTLETMDYPDDVIVVLAGEGGARELREEICSVNGNTITRRVQEQIIQCLGMDSKAIKAKSKRGGWKGLVIGVVLMAVLCGGYFYIHSLPEFKGSGAFGDMEITIDQHQPYFLWLKYENGAQPFTFGWVDHAKAQITTDEGVYYSDIYTTNGSGEVKSGTSGHIFMFCPSLKGKIKNISLSEVYPLNERGLPDRGYQLLGLPANTIEIPISYVEDRND